MLSLDESICITFFCHVLQGSILKIISVLFQYFSRLHYVSVRAGNTFYRTTEKSYKLQAFVDLIPFLQAKHSPFMDSTEKL